jgi:hypothetical protein
VSAVLLTLLILLTAVLAVLLLLAGLLLPALLLTTLLLLAGLLLSALLLATLLLLAGLLLSGLLLSALLLAALLLARFLVRILIHRSVLSNIGSKRHFDRSRPLAKGNTWPKHLFHFICPLNFEANAFGTPRLRVEFPSCNKEDRRWDVICCCGFSGYQFPFWY